MITNPLSVRKSGFTLLELSIVLIIIGLIVGGVLVGRDLIKSSEIRGTISQYEQYNTATHTFRLKYNALPGDMPPLEAASYGFFQLTTTGVNYGDNDGLIDGATQNEGLVFWRHLSEAALVNGNFGVSGNNAIDPSSGRSIGASSNIGLSFPKSRLSGASHFAALNDPTYPGTYFDGHNYFMLLGLTDIGFAGTFIYAIPPADIAHIDQKLDDGIPWVGRVRGIGPWAATATLGNCSYSGSGQLAADTQYNVVGSNGSAPSCMAYLFFK